MAETSAFSAHNAHTAFYLSERVPAGATVTRIVISKNVFQNVGIQIAHKSGIQIAHLSGTYQAQTPSNFILKWGKPPR